MYYTRIWFSSAGMCENKLRQRLQYNIAACITPSFSGDHNLTQSMQLSFSSAHIQEKQLWVAAKQKWWAGMQLIGWRKACQHFCDAKLTQAGFLSACKLELKHGWHTTKGTQNLCSTSIDLVEEILAEGQTFLLKSLWPKASHCTTKDCLAVSMGHNSNFAKRDLWRIKAQLAEDIIPIRRGVKSANMLWQSFRENAIR